MYEDLSTGGVVAGLLLVRPTTKLSRRFVSSDHKRSISSVSIRTQNVSKNYGSLMDLTAKGDSQKASPCAETRRAAYRLLKSIHPLL